MTDLCFRVNVAKFDGPDPGSGAHIKDAFDLVTLFIWRRETELAFQRKKKQVMLQIWKRVNYMQQKRKGSPFSSTAHLICRFLFRRSGRNILHQLA